MVTWDPVKATDNEQATVTVLPDVTSPHEFHQGNFTIIYTAKDPSQNTKFCYFKVQVKGNVFFLLLLLSTMRRNDYSSLSGTFITDKTIITIDKR